MEKTDILQIPMAKLSSEVCVLVSSIDDLISHAYSNIPLNFSNHDWLRERAILATRNEDVNGINNGILDIIPGECVEYKPIDSTVDAHVAVNYPVEFLSLPMPFRYAATCSSTQGGLSSNAAAKSTFTEVVQ